MTSAAAPSGSWEQSWVNPLRTEIQSLSHSGETHHLLVCDVDGWVYHADDTGQIQTQKHFPRLATAILSQNGSKYAVADKTGQIYLLSPDFTVRWQQSVEQPILSLAMDPHGHFLAAADNNCGVHIWNAEGQLQSQITVTRPLVHMSFLQEVPLLVGNADFGLVLALDLNGQILWRDHPLVKMNSLSADAVGRNLLVACYSEGIHVYQATTGEKRPRLATREPCLFVEQSVCGQRILTGSVKNTLHELNAEGQQVSEFVCGRTLRAMVLSALGEYVIVALKGGQLKKLQRKAQP